MIEIKFVRQENARRRLFVDYSNYRNESERRNTGLRCFPRIFFVQKVNFQIDRRFCSMKMLRKDFRRQKRERLFDFHVLKAGARDFC